MGRSYTSPLQNFLFCTLFESLKFEILHISSNRSELFSIQRYPKYVLWLELFVKDETYSEFYVVLSTFELTFKQNDPDFPSSNTAEAKHFPHFKFVSLHARSVWETICDAVASSSGINLC